MADSLIKFNGSNANTNEATIFTVPASTAYLIGLIHVCNKNAATKYVTIKADSSEIVYQRGIETKDALTLSFAQPLVLEAGDTLKITQEAANDLVYYISGIAVSV